MSEKATKRPWRAGKGGYLLAPDGPSREVQVAKIGDFYDMELLPFNRARWQADLDLIVEAVNSYDAAQERIRELERALQPFAEIAKEFTGQLSDDRKNTMHWAVPTVGQFRAALRALSTARPIPEKEESNPAVPVDAIVNLVNHQQQCDEDGVMVQVSRQALCEVLAYITEVRPDNKWAARKEESK